MKKYLLTLPLALLSFQSWSGESPCPNIEYNKDSSVVKAMKSCEVQKEFAQKNEIRDTHKKIIYKKLASRLATQIKQNSEEFSLLTSAFKKNGNSQLMSYPQVKESCQLEKFIKIETCGGKITPFQKEKLNFLKENFPSNANTPFSDDQRLYGIVAGKFFSDLGLQATSNNLQCPLNSTTGNFSLDSQLDDISAEDILNTINLSNSDDVFYNKYGQLKIIKDAGPKTLEAFRQFMKSKPDSVSANKQISIFFANKNNEEILANTLAKKCDDMNTNLNTFLCSDLEELGSLNNKISATLFGGLNVKEKLDVQDDLDFKEPVLIAYGMQCLAKEKNVNKSNTQEINTESSVDKWFEHFTYQSRPGDSKASAKEDVNNFCSLYSCKDTKALSTASCKNGGPISSHDLEVLFACESATKRSEQCTSQMLKSIGLLKDIESLKKDYSDKKVSTSSNILEDKKNGKISGHLPSFAENFFGAEGTLKALGKQVTPEILAEKHRDLENSKIASLNNSSPPPTAAVPTAPQASNTQQAKNTEAPPSETYNPQPAYQPEYNPTAKAVSPSTQHASASTPKSDSVASNKNYKIQPEASTTSKESQQLRDEMEKMLKDMKDQSGEAETTVADNDSSPKSSAKQKSTKSTSSLEEANFKNRQRELDEREDNLNQYRRELDDRAARSIRTVADEGSPNRTGAGKVGVTESDMGASSSGGVSSSGSGSNSAASLKLSSSAAGKVDQKTNTAAIIQSGKESSMLSVEELSQLSPDNLKELGIDSSKPFVLRVNFNKKTYEVPVKTFVHKGTNILGPVIDPRNKDLKEFLLKSPLFKPFLDYRVERESLINI